MRVQPQLVDLQRVESAHRATSLVITPSATHLRKVAHALEQAVGDTRRAAASGEAIS